MGNESYFARADAERAKLVADTSSPFTIEVRFHGGLTDRQMAAFNGAAERWVKLIVGDLPSMIIDGEEIDDVLIHAQGIAINGPGQTLGAAQWMVRREESAGAGLPAMGVMWFDTADLAEMEASGSLDHVITHEMGHVLGVGRKLWAEKGLIAGECADDPVFTGAHAMDAYRALRGDDEPRPVPLENQGEDGTRCTHWRERVFRNELMTGYLNPNDNPLSRLTAASLADLGYQVDLDAAEPYTLPTVLTLTEESVLVAPAAIHGMQPA